MWESSFIDDNTRVLTWDNATIELEKVDYIGTGVIKVRASAPLSLQRWLKKEVKRLLNVYYPCRIVKKTRFSYTWANDSIRRPV